MYSWWLYFRSLNSTSAFFGGHRFHVQGGENEFFSGEQRNQSCVELSSGLRPQRRILFRYAPIGLFSRSRAPKVYTEQK